MFALTLVADVAVVVVVVVAGCYSKQSCQVLDVTDSNSNNNSNCCKSCGYSLQSATRIKFKCILSGDAWPRVNLCLF